MAKASPITGPDDELDELDEIQSEYDIRRRAESFRQVEPVDLLTIKANEVSGTPPTTILVKPTELYIDGRYQRNISRSGMRLILKIVQNFSWQKFRAPVVTRDEQERWVIIDGQHTAIGAASHPGIKQIPVSFIPMKDLSDQARAFISHNTDRVSVPNMDLFFSRVAAGEQIVLDIMEVIDRHGIVLVRNINLSSNQQLRNMTMATGELTKLIKKYDKTRFEDIIKTVAAIGFSPVRRDHLTAIAELLYESAHDDIKIDPELLVNLLRDLKDTTSINEARRIATSMNYSIGKGLAIYYRNRYTDRYGRRGR